jgi:acetylornithine deacetylase/succinyl-diaminopimelate desuccinylase-like protein
VTGVVELTTALIEAPSPNPPGDERAVAAVVTEALPVAPRMIAKAPERPNLLASLDFGPGGRHLVLCGHIDTKPVGGAGWSVDPFRATIDGERLYGLGSTDMKGAVAAMIVAAWRMRPARGRLTLLLVADEEAGAVYGAKLVASEVDADAIVIGEPCGVETDFDRLPLVSRGIARWRAVARGRQGHSSLSGGPSNAGVDAARAVVALADGGPLTAPENRFGLDGWELTLNPALRYDGGVGYGVLPAEIAALCEVRLLPGTERGALTAELQARLNGVSLEWDEVDWLEATAVAPDDPIAVAARHALGGAVPDSVFPGTTDAAWLAPRAPTLPALGPGLLSRAHAADEWVSVAALHRTVELYVALAEVYCAGNEPSAAPGDSLTAP